MLRISAAYTPPPPDGFVSPVTWGVEENVRDRFVRAGVDARDIACERATYMFRYPRPPSAFLALFRNYYGPTMDAFEAAAGSGREDQLEAELTELFEAQNKGGADSTEIPAAYLKVIVTRR